MTASEPYAVAIVGGATAGAEAAAIFASQGFLTVVIEQNSRPYGKVEDGLPRWHEGLRNKEYAAIDAKLDRDHVHFVPLTCLGRDLSFPELCRDWGFHAVVLALGAWRDRPLPIEGVDAYVGRGLVYQNAFIHWFNHYPEKGYDGPQYEITDDAIVIGGGLASIDVAKALQLELAVRALRERGIEQDLCAMELRGIPETLRGHGLEWKDLGLRGCTLYYRRRVDDMPLIELPDGASERVREKIVKGRRRVLDKAIERYLFRFQPLSAPSEAILEEERLVGIRFARTRIVDGRVALTGERFDVRGSQVLSSIGSIPEPLEGIEMKGELYAFDDWDLGRMRAYPNVYSVGNVVTGKGNIVASRKHSRWVTDRMLEEYFRIADEVRKLPPLSERQRSTILERVAQLQRRVGYEGRYRDWISAASPEEAS
ncbi:MAG: hypothetical protein ACE5IL_08745 [Myxococcota bacterium]